MAMDDGAVGPGRSVISEDAQDWESHPMNLDLERCGFFERCIFGHISGSAFPLGRWHTVDADRMGRGITDSLDSGLALIESENKLCPSIPIRSNSFNDRLFL